MVEFVLVIASMVSYLLSFGYLKHVEAEAFNNEQEQADEMMFAVRMLFASSTTLFLLVLSALMDTESFKRAAVAIGIFACIIIFKIDCMPIWEDR